MGHVETLPKDIAAAVTERQTMKIAVSAIGKAFALLASGPVIWGKPIKTSEGTNNGRQIPAR